MKYWFNDDWNEVEWHKFISIISVPYRLKPNQTEHTYMTPGGRLNKKDGLTRYGDSHVKDKTS